LYAPGVVKFDFAVLLRLLFTETPNSIKQCETFCCYLLWRK